MRDLDNSLHQKFISLSYTYYIRKKSRISRGVLAAGSLKKSLKKVDFIGLQRVFNFWGIDNKNNFM